MIRFPNPWWLAAVSLVAAVAYAEDKPLSPPGTVTMPLSDYDRLIDRAARPPKGIEAPPLDAVVSRAEMKLRVADDFVRGTFKLEGEVFRKGAARVPLITGATLLDTSLQNTTPPLALENGRHSAILVGPRLFEIDLGWGAAVVTEPGRASIQIPVPLAGSVSLTIDLPGDVSDVRVEPGLVTGKTVNGGRTIVEASPDRANSVRVSWAARATTTAVPRESRFLADIKTLITVDEVDLRMAALLDISVVQGQPDRFEVIIPAGWTLTSATGGTLDTFSLPNGTAVLNMREAERRTHQVLLGFERPTAGVKFPLDVGVVTITGAQRETGEVAVEGIGSLELNADEKGAVKRMDTKETHAALKALAREPLLAAFRYHMRGGESVAVLIDVKRFPETTTLAAIADRAQVTSLVTTEGRVLTEVTLTVRNHAQPFLRVALPTGATILSAEVGGEGVKPAMGEGGTRIPLLRPGFRPSGPYEVSYVYQETSSAFAKRGDGLLTLPRMDVPVGLVSWEVFLPDQLQVREFGGNVAREDLWQERRTASFGSPASKDGSADRIGGLAGGNRPDTSVMSPIPESLDSGRDLKSVDKAERTNEAKPSVQSANVVNLQRRVAGVLPVRIDIPRAGRSYRFARPLVVDEESMLTFKYKAK